MRKQEPEIIEMSNFLNIFNKETDRGSALVAASYLDEALKKIINAYLIESKITDELINGFNAPIGTFSSRINMSYSLGLISKEELEILNTVRKIRNDFGHKWGELSFEIQPISDRVKSLNWYGPKDILDRDNKSRFNFGVVQLLVSLLWRERKVKKDKLNQKKIE